MRQKGEKITMLTAYDYSTARIIDEVGIPLPNMIGRSKPVASPLRSKASLWTRAF